MYVSNKFDLFPQFSRLQFSSWYILRDRKETPSPVTCPNTTPSLPRWVWNQTRFRYHRRWFLLPIEIGPARHPDDCLHPVRAVCELTPIREPRVQPLKSGLRRRGTTDSRDENICVLRRSQKIMSTPTHSKKDSRWHVLRTANRLLSIVSSFSCNLARNDKETTRTTRAPTLPFLSRNYLPVFGPWSRPTSISR